MRMPDGLTWMARRWQQFRGDADFGNQGAQRQTYEVLSFCNELLRYELPLHPLPPARLYAWALAFPVGESRHICHWDHSLVSHPSPAAFPRPFRPPSYRLRLMADSAVLERRAYLAPAWASGLTQARQVYVKVDESSHAGQVAALFHTFARELALAPEAPMGSDNPDRVDVEALLAADPPPE
ncbi:hypothetical protein MMPV_010195, partial [Pyropia vietnamensis]